MPCFRDAGAYGFDLRSAEEMMEAERRETDLRRRLHPMSVVARVHAWHQPPGGLLPVSLFSRRVMDDPMPLHDSVAETVPADIAGLYVDYMTRAMTGSDVRDAFRVPLTGARLVGDGARAERLVSMVDGFSGGSIRAACMLLDYGLRPRVQAWSRGLAAAAYRRGRADVLEPVAHGRPQSRVPRRVRSCGVA